MGDQYDEQEEHDAKMMAGCIVLVSLGLSIAALCHALYLCCCVAR